MINNSRKLIVRLESDGWVLIRVSGSHHVFTKPGVAHRIVLPHPKKDLGRGLVLEIYRIAGWPKD